MNLAWHSHCLYHAGNDSYKQYCLFSNPVICLYIIVLLKHALYFRNKYCLNLLHSAFFFFLIIIIWCAVHDLGLLTLLMTLWVINVKRDDNFTWLFYVSRHGSNIRFNAKAVFIGTDISFSLSYKLSTRGIWKVLSMVLYLSNRFTNPIMFGIILKSYLCSMLWHKFHGDIIMQTRKIVLWIHVLFVYWKTQNLSGKYIILPFEKCDEH